MEHRYNRRIPLNINALIYKHGTPVALGRIKNGSTHGLYLETDYRDVRELQKLELEILLGRRVKSNKHCQVKALVVRKSEFGYGLDLEMLNDEASRPLRDYIEQRLNDQHRQHRDLLQQTGARAAALERESELRRSRH